MAAATLTKTAAGYSTPDGYTVTKSVAGDGYVTWNVRAADGSRANLEYLREARPAIAAHRQSAGRTWSPWLV